MKRAIYKFLFIDVFGWKIEGHPNKTVKKQMTIAGPHTSGWDLFVGLATREIETWDIGFIAKKSLFKGPVGWFFRWMGGMPVDRSKRTNMVDSLVDLFNSKEKLAIVLAPEGTREKVDKLKSGFYYVALGAKIPVFMVGLNYAKKTVELNELFYPTGNFEQDMAFITSYFKGIKGKIPSKGI
jgi:1-acyl-sn-glycerol-3-phosphate acyltransferase